jgi:hypothetical protein
MKTMKRKRLTRALASVLGAAAMTATAVHAQQVAQTTEKIQVTGSNIRRDEACVVTIARAIQQSRQRDIAELLRNVPR